MVQAPATDDNTDVPYGGGGGNTIDGQYSNVGPLVAGTVKATLTWIPNPALPADPAPSQVYILESTNASWLLPQRVGGPRKRTAPQPSAELISLPSSGRAHILTVQAQTPSGQANDGFNHPTVVSTDGTSGSSSGYTLSTINVVGNQVTTSNVTLSASVSNPPQGTQTSWSYSAQILALQITCNGQDITSPKPAYQAYAGQNTALAFSGVPTGVTVNTPKWSLPDKYVKDWIHSDASASVVPLPVAELSSTSIPQLFWVSGGSKAVSFTANIGGTSVTFNGNISVNRPEYDFSLTPGTIAHGGGVRLDVDGSPTLQLGTPNTTGAGVTFVVPGKPNPNNILTLVQIITGTTRTIVDGNGIIHSWSPTSGLDRFPMFGSDSPGQGFPATYTEIIINEQFDDWLMYNPPVGGTEHQDWIHVPLKKLSWSWGAQAKRRGAGWVASTIPDATNTNSDLVSATPAQDAPGVNTLDHPTWTQKASDPEGHYDPPV